MFLYLFLFLFLVITGFAEPLRLDVRATSAIMINAETGVVLYEKNSHEMGYPASTTKIATTIYALERGNVDENALIDVKAEALKTTSEQAKKKAQYKLPAYYLEDDGTMLGLKKGEQIRFLDLLYGSMLLSGNDASNVIAQYIGGTIPDFMKDLNTYLQDFGCSDTHFANPHGLTHPDHYTTARDMALIAQHALKNPTFRKIASTIKYICPKNSTRGSITLLNTNRLLRKGPYFYPKAIGIKTGYTAAAQHNLVAAAEHEGRILIAVLMHSKERNDLWQDATKLFQAAFTQPLVERVLLPAGLQPYQLTIPGARRTLKTVLTEPLVWQFYPAEEEPIHAKLVWENLSLPIPKGHLVALVQVTTASGRLVASTPLLAAHEVKLSLPITVLNGIKSHPWWTGGILLLFLCLILYKRRR